MKYGIKILGLVVATSGIASDPQLPFIEIASSMAQASLYHPLSGESYIRLLETGVELASLGYLFLLL
jgi:hypothetical protein